MATAGLAGRRRKSFGGTSYGLYQLDQSIPGITGCFINLTVNSTDTSGNTYPFVTTWYFKQEVNDTQINVAWTNLETVYENVPTSVNYVAFV